CIPGKHSWIDDKIITHDTRGGNEDGKLDAPVHVCVSCDKRFYETGHDKERHQSHNNLEPLEGSSPERFESRVCARKEDAVAHYNSGGAGDNDGAQFNCSVKHHDGRCLKERAFVIKHGKERAQHHSIIEKHETGDHRSKHTHDEHPE